jgi:hypothetical protein
VTPRINIGRPIPISIIFSSGSIHEGLNAAVEAEPQEPLDVTASRRTKTDIPTGPTITAEPIQPRAQTCDQASNVVPYLAAKQGGRWMEIKLG